MQFNSEESLVQSFLDALQTHWDARYVTREFDYQRGRTDVIIVTDDGMVVAIEAKLLHWRKALQQAYRNTCFAHESYVLLPRKVALHAFRYVEEFSKRQVGLCYLQDDDLIVLHSAQKGCPIEPWLTEQAGTFAKSAGSTQSRDHRESDLR